MPQPLERCVECPSRLTRTPLVARFVAVRVAVCLAVRVVRCERPSLLTRRNFEAAIRYGMCRVSFEFGQPLRRAVSICAFETQVNEARHTCEWVTLHIGMSHDTRVGWLRLVGSLKL